MPPHTPALSVPLATVCSLHAAPLALAPAPRLQCLPPPQVAGALLQRSPSFHLLLFRSINDLTRGFLCRWPPPQLTGVRLRRLHHCRQARRRRRPLLVSPAPPSAAKWCCRASPSLTAPLAGCLAAGQAGTAGPLR
jgi:hypothetical protein